ncbi:MAG TPA: H-X9-DG-CTERM domain-containing protein [Urbifossiella sp.]|jgi:hypothetical protein|nr:H-X9-DG-CTERM domain-containing protein [Urbifossiella sp.]
MTPTVAQRLARRTAVAAASAVALVAAGTFTTPPEAAAQPPAAARGLAFVPADAAAFIHADVAALWTSPIGEAVRKAEPKLTGDLAAGAKKMFGVAPEDLKTVTAFWPNLSNPQEGSAFGVVLTFKVPFDAAALKAGVVKELPGGLPLEFRAPDPTTYQAFVGKGAAFDLLRGPRLPADFLDGTSNTILVATAATPVPWTKPDDMAFDPAGDMRRVVGFFPDVCHTAMADGSVRMLSRGISKATLHGAITRDGGEVLGPDF